jgi:predicted aspartyl protease
MVGLFAVDIQIAGPAHPRTFRDVHGVMVDTGSEATWISAELLEGAGIAVERRGQPFVMANGAQVTRDIGYAVIRCGEFQTVDEVVFAHPGDFQLLGAHTLEGFNARVDPHNKRLLAGGPRLAATCSECLRSVWLNADFGLGNNPHCRLTMPKYTAPLAPTGRA